MPPSVPDQEQAPAAGQILATLAEILCLDNLLLLPGLAFVAPLGLFVAKRASAPPLAAAHLSPTLSASLWAGALLVLANLLIPALGGYTGPGDLGGADRLFHCLPLHARATRGSRPRQGDGRAVLAPPLGRPSVAFGMPPMSRCCGPCDNACAMRLHPRTIKRRMFTCTECAECISACIQIQGNDPRRSLLRWVDNDCALPVVTGRPATGLTHCVSLDGAQPVRVSTDRRERPA